ncbi:hypothetical protein [Peribacillus frigoritolerans]|uniref:hypothetical protein n=1 Tax=Peribacillus castrilensis TaxID=2897690 RepID=UPI002DCE2CF8|nr:hypothetical protein [Peribacillus castrilensis]
MDKGKYIIFIIIILLFVFIIGVPYINDLIKSKDALKFNDAESITLNNGNYIVGKDINSGIYDIEVLTQEIEVFGKKLDEGDQLLGFKLSDDEKLIINGKGSVKFIKASFDKLKKNNKQYIINHSGQYIVGKQIPTGQYKVSYSDPKGEISKQQPFIQVSKKIGKEIITSFNINNKSQMIKLENDNILFIANTMNQEHNYVEIILTPQ